MSADIGRTPSSVPVTRFARSSGVDIAYQVVGDGPLDVVVLGGWISHCDLLWELAEMARFLDRFTEFGRLIRFDRRGIGMSDRVSAQPTLEQRMDDLVTVLDESARQGWQSARGASACRTPCCLPRLTRSASQALSWGR